MHNKVSHGAYKHKYKNPIHLKHIQIYIKHKRIKGTKPKKHKNNIINIPIHKQSIK